MKRKISAIAGMLLILHLQAISMQILIRQMPVHVVLMEKKMVSSFDSNKLAVSVSEMEPGDTVDFRVAVKMTVIYLQTGIWQMT